MKESKQKQHRFNLRRRFIFGLLTITLALTIALGAAITLKYTNRMEEEYTNEAFNYATIIAEYIDGDTIKKYETTLEKDGYYEEVRAFLNQIATLVDLEYCYVVVPYEDEMFYIWDTGQGKGVLDLGATDAYYGGGDIMMHKAFEGSNKRVMLVTDNEFYGYLASAYVMIPDSEGNPVALACVDLSMEQIDDHIRSFILVMLLVVGSIIGIAIIVYYRVISKTVITPLQKLQTAATHIIRNNDINSSFEEIGTISTADEIQDLAEAFQYMIKELREYIKNLEIATAEKERIGAELDIATKIQTDMLPSIFPPYPDCKAFDLYASMTPAKEVGGDFYDFFLIDENHLALVIADVSGKGIPAALFMVISKTLIKNNATPGKTPKEILEMVNKQLCENNQASMFVTVWMGILEISTGKITAVNAGHEFPVIKRLNGDFEYLHDQHGMMLAAFDMCCYKEYEIWLNPGDRLFLYTDGIPEATNANEELLGEKRQLAILNQYKDEELSVILKYIKADIDAFVGEAPQFDDLTMMIIEYKGI
ncbi:MAG: SpoIIE family protein phosphatase [Cellulosilyticum sp.]|nr:SpoIIE family protein phosphatase [Cellulosilyticum sp.]